MSRRDRLGVFRCQLDQRFICSRPADETFSGRLTKCQSKFDAWHRAHERFVNILNGLDKMRLTQDEVGVFRLFDLYSFDFHKSISYYGCQQFSKQARLVVSFDWWQLFSSCHFVCPASRFRKAVTCEQSNTNWVACSTS